MSKTEIALIRQALQILHRLVPDDEPRAVDITPRRCPVVLFTKRYCVRHPGADTTCAELWNFYAEVAASGEVERLTKQEFLRALPGAMAAVFGVNKCHSIQREGRTLRGFKSVDIRMDTRPATVGAVEPDDDLAGFRRGIRRRLFEKPIQ